MAFAGFDVAHGFYYGNFNAQFVGYAFVVVLAEGGVTGVFVNGLDGAVCVIGKNVGSAAGNCNNRCGLIDVHVVKIK